MVFSEFQAKNSKKNFSWQLRGRHSYGPPTTALEWGRENSQFSANKSPYLRIFVFVDDGKLFFSHLKWSKTARVRFSHPPGEWRRYCFRSVCVCVCVCVCLRSGLVNQTSLKRLKLRTLNLACMFPGIVRT